MSKNTRVYGSDRMSYTVKLNRDQCAYRLYLMGDPQNRGEALLFPAMVRGLIIHRVAEWMVKGQPVDWEALKEGVVKPSRPDVDFGDRIIVWGKTDPETFWSELKREVGRFERCFHHLLNRTLPMRVEAEVELRRTFQTEIMGHADLVFRGEGETIVADLKTGKYDPKSEQFLLYSWLANGFQEKTVPFWVLVWDGSELKRVVLQHNLSEKNPTLMKLLWTMEDIRRELIEAEMRITKGKHPALVLKPNTAHYTCQPNRCSYWKVCPYGAKRQEAKNG